MTVFKQSECSSRFQPIHFLKLLVDGKQVLFGAPTFACNSFDFQFCKKIVGIFLKIHYLYDYINEPTREKLPPTSSEIICNYFHEEIPQRENIIIFLVRDNKTKREKNIII